MFCSLESWSPESAVNALLELRVASARGRPNLGSLLIGADLDHKELCPTAQDQHRRRFGVGLMACGGVEVIDERPYDLGPGRGVFH